MLLDMRTIVFSYVLTDIVCLVVIVLLWQQNRKRFAGTGFFVFDFALQTVTLFLIVLRGQIPDWISIVLANALAGTGMLFGYMGLLRFVGKKSFQIHNYILLTAFVFVHAYFALFQPNLAVRNLNLSIILLIICFQCAWLMLYRVEPGRRQLTRGVGIVFAAFCVISAIRIAEYFTSVHLTDDYLHAGRFEQFVLISYQMLFILLTYSLALMFNKRLLLDIATQEEKFSKAFHSSPYAITLTRISDGQIIEVNESFFRITGYQLADVKGNNTIGMHLWDREEDRTLIIRDLASKGKVHDREFQFRKKSGEIITGLFSAEIITVNNEKSVLSSINDITERKLAEEALRETRDYLNNLINYANAPIITWNSNNKITRFNHAFEGLTGYSANEVMGKKLQILFTQDSRDESLQKIARTSAGEFWESVEIPIKRKDGEIRVALWNSANILDREGNKLFETIAQGQDITERKQAEVALRDSEVRFRSLFNNMSSGVSVYEAVDNGGDFIFLDFNHAAEKIENISRKDIIGKRVTEAFPGVKAFGIFEVFQRVWQTGNMEYFPQNIYEDERLPGSWRESWVFKLPSGEIVAVYNDVTVRKRAEAEIIHLNALLEARVNKRTNELRDSQLALLTIVEDLNESNQKIAVTNQSLDAINKELESFSYSVSHDLRAPLRSIDGFSQALLDDYSKNLDYTGRNYLERIRTAAQNMSMLIDDMLKLSRVIKAEFRLESVNASKMFQDIIRKFRQNNPARKVKVIIQKDLILTVDSHMLEIAMTNLIDNAWKFTGKTENARIELGMLLKDGKPVIFIRDNGVGFDMSYVNKLFGTFQRLHTKSEFMGTGIGLAIVKRIIARHGGEVWAEGEVGSGATFYFTLPE